MSNRITVPKNESAVLIRDLKLGQLFYWESPQNGAVVGIKAANPFSEVEEYVGVTLSEGKYLTAAMEVTPIEHGTVVKIEAQ